MDGLGGVLGGLGGILGRLGGILGASEAISCRFGDVLGRFEGVLEASWGHLFPLTVGSADARGPL